jgi:hypothetical protein
MFIGIKSPLLKWGLPTCPETPVAIVAPYFAVILPISFLIRPLHGFNMIETRACYLTAVQAPT